VWRCLETLEADRRSAGLILALTFWSQPQVFTDSWVELASTITLIALFVGAYKHLECHISGCHRVGRFVHGQYKLCHQHHPGVPSSGKITLEEIAKVKSAVSEAPDTHPAKPPKPPPA
jgi:hypothetical protein